jgi:hypothetical protein
MRSPCTLCVNVMNFPQKCAKTLYGQNDNAVVFVLGNTQLRIA